MNKYLVMVLVSLGLASCTVKDERYYLTHPKQLEQALKACPTQPDQGLDCDKLKQLGSRMEQLANQLQYSPQGFGHKILALQETIAKQEMELKKTPNTPELKKSLEQNKHDLGDYLAVVKWLESPRA